jgi:hypothetical protein
VVARARFAEVGYEPQKVVVEDEIVQRKKAVAPEATVPLDIAADLIFVEIEDAPDFGLAGFTGLLVVYSDVLFYAVHSAGAPASRQRRTRAGSLVCSSL